MRFLYEAATVDKTVRRGTIDSTSREEALGLLRQRGVSVLTLTAAASADRSLARTLSLRRRISPLETVGLIRHLAIMLRSGISLVEALGIAREQTDSPALRRALQGVNDDVANGTDLADSLERWPRAFPGMVTSMIRVGEASGTLEQNLEYVARELEKEHALRRKVKSAMLYPMIVLSATFVLGIGLSVFILPRLVKMFSTFRIELPLATQVFLGVANFLVDHGWWLLILFVGVVIGLRLAKRIPVVRAFYHRLALNAPLFGKLVRQSQMTRVFRILSTLLASGVTINESLEITRQATTNVWYQRELQRARVGVQKGAALAAVLNDERYLPTMANRMIEVGEKTGKLEESLSYLANYYEEEVDAVTKDIATLLEPILLIVIAIVMGFLAVAIISPIYQFTGSLQR